MKIEWEQDGNAARRHMAVSSRGRIAAMVEMKSDYTYAAWLTMVDARHCGSYRSLTEAQQACERAIAEETE